MRHQPAIVIRFQAAFIIVHKLLDKVYLHKILQSDGPQTNVPGTYPYLAGVIKDQDAKAAVSWWCKPPAI